MKLPRLAAATAAAVIAACVNTMRPESDVHRIVAPDLRAPLVENYPGPAMPKDPVKAAVFDRINRDRAAHGVAPVLWDEAASRVSDAFCAQQVREGTQGHFLTDGLPPYARTGFAGVFGLGSENSVSWRSTESFERRDLAELGLSGHQRMMEERPPADGHRRTILDPEATHVGVGYASRAGRFQLSQEFQSRRLETMALSQSSSRLPVLRVEGRTVAPLHVQFVTIAREDVPKPISVAAANGHTSYSYPDGSEAYVPEGYRSMRVVGAVTLDRLRLKRDRDFSFTYLPSQPGLFTFVIYVGQEGRAPTQGGSCTVLFE